ncbi:MAG: hypothetical protein WBP93_22575 [Pyrinomonadaceae bacterium]
MTSSNQLKTGSRHAPLTRMLAFALLVLVTFSATAEAVHKHGNLAGVREAVSSASISNAPDSNSRLRNTQTGAECLICQLHQHLFATVLNRPPHIAPPQTQHVQAQATATSYLSQTDAPRRGRAPPLSSLS